MTAPIPVAHSERVQPPALHIYRLIVWAVVLVAILVLIRQPLPGLPEAPRADSSGVTSSFASDFSRASTSNDLREYSADSAPKQQVVNGWYTNDLLGIIGRQNDALLRNQSRLIEATEAATSQGYEFFLYQARDRRPESLLVVLGMGAAAHLAGSSLILLLARRPRQVKAATPTERGEFDIENAEPPVPATPFDPRPHH